MNNNGIFFLKPSGIKKISIDEIVKFSIKSDVQYL